MIATFIPDLLTPFSFPEAAEAMRAAMDSAVPVGGGRTRDDVLALALAKTGLETGRWHAIHRYNWGNIKAGEQYVGMFTTFRCNEVINGVVKWFDPTTDGFENPPGHPQTRFRAYANRYDGAYQYVDFILQGRYRKAWDHLLLGDAQGFVHELKLAGYFTAPEAPYARAVVSMQQEFLKLLRGMPPEHVEKTDIEWERLKACLRGRPLSTFDFPEGFDSGTKYA